MSNIKRHKTTLATLAFVLGMLCLTSHGLSLEANPFSNLEINKDNLNKAYVENRQESHLLTPSASNFRYHRLVRIPGHHRSITLPLYNLSLVTITLE